MAFGYFPDYKITSPLRDLYLRVLGYPYPSRRSEAGLVFKLLNSSKRDVILDIGCGDGIWTNDIASRGLKVTGVDASNLDLAKAKKRAKQMRLRVSYKKENAERMSFADEEFDKAYSISTFEHIKKDQAAFDEVARALKSGGVFVLSVPTGKILWLPSVLIKLPARLKSFFRKPVRQSKTVEEYRENLDKDFFHYRTYDLNLLKNRLKKAGLNIEEVRFNISLLAVLPQNIYHSFRVFDWEKSATSDYKFNNEWIFALCFPIFYPLYLLDNILDFKSGHVLVVKARKA